MAIREEMHDIINNIELEEDHGLDNENAILMKEHLLYFTSKLYKLLDIIFVTNYNQIYNFLYCYIIKWILI